MELFDIAWIAGLCRHPKFDAKHRTINNAAVDLRHGFMGVLRSSVTDAANMVRKTFYGFQNAVIRSRYPLHRWRLMVTTNAQGADQKNIYPIERCQPDQTISVTNLTNMNVRVYDHFREFLI